MVQPIEVLAAMITPAVLISAAALVLLSTANRLGRLNDRLDSLVKEVERFGTDLTGEAGKRQLVLTKLSSLLERVLLLRSAITGIYVTIGLLVVTSIAAGMHVIFPRISVLPMSVGLLGALAFLYSIVLLIREAAIAVRLTLAEIAYVRALLDDQAD